VIEKKNCIRVDDNVNWDPLFHTIAFVLLAKFNCTLFAKRNQLYPFSKKNTYQLRVGRFSSVFVVGQGHIFGGK
jgi:hypothetical protein